MIYQVHFIQVNIQIVMSINKLLSNSILNCKQATILEFITEWDFQLVKQIYGLKLEDLPKWLLLSWLYQTNTLIHIRHEQIIEHRNFTVKGLLKFIKTPEVEIKLKLGRRYPVKSCCHQSAGK